MSHAATSPNPKSPRRNSQVTSTTNSQLRKVIRLGVTPAFAHQRVTTRAGRGHTNFVTRSVSPLYEAANVRASISAALSSRTGRRYGGSDLRKAAEYAGTRSVGTTGRAPRRRLDSSGAVVSEKSRSASLT